jgi:trk system potassium uptake protein TrkH
MNLFNAEGHPDRLMPSLKKTSQTIFMIYSFFLILGILGFYLSGMGLFDALCHTMSALSTAGFTTKAGSIGYYRSLPIEIITIILMLIGSTNFAILLILSRGKFRRAFRVSEVRFMIGLLIVFVPLVAFSLVRNMGLSFGESLINSLFGIVTTFTTTGYSIMDYAHWPPFAVGLLILLMFIGGSAGSTAGGIKLIRAYLLIRIATENIRNRLSPVQRITKPAHYRVQSREFIDNNLIKDTVGFVACYVAVFFIGTLLLTLTADCTLYDAMFEFASAFGTVGISNGLANANASIGSLLVLIIGMILGRLEVFIVFIAIYSGIQTIKNKITNHSSLDHGKIISEENKQENFHET